MSILQRNGVLEHNMGDVGTILHHTSNSRRSLAMVDQLAQFATWIVIGASALATLAVWAVVVTR